MYPYPRAALASQKLRLASRIVDANSLQSFAPSCRKRFAESLTRQNEQQGRRTDCRGGDEGAGLREGALSSAW
jgi:hypothetical protein